MPHILFRFALYALLLFPLLVGTPAPAATGSCTLVPLSFAVQSVNKGLAVETGFRVDNLGVARNLLRDGAQLVLDCTLSLERLRTVLRNVPLSEVSLRLHLRHDALTRDFLLYVEGQPLRRSRNLNQLLDPFAKDLQILLPLELPLESGEDYRLTLRLTLQYAEVPPWLERALFFWSWDVAPPVSLSKEFRY